MGPWALSLGTHLLCRFPGSKPRRPVRPPSIFQISFPILESTSLNSAKTALRNEVLAIRDGLSTETRITMSLEAGENLLNLALLQNPTIVSGFWPIRSEIDLRPVLADIRDRGGRICLPVVLDKQTIEFRELGREAPMIETGFGTLGPDESAAVLDPTLILVPLSAFDRCGGRLGYGAGFYDRAIGKLHAKLIRPLLIGMAFSCQQVDQVPMESHDQRLDYIVTERATINCTSNESF